MTLPASISDREHRKFRDVNGQPTVSVVLESPVEVTQDLVSRILVAPDRSRDFTWLDFGLSTARLSTIVYTAPSVGSYTLTRTFNYTNVSGSYRLDGDEYALT